MAGPASLTFLSKAQALDVSNTHTCTLSRLHSLVSAYTHCMAAEFRFPSALLASRPLTPSSSKIRSRPQFSLLPQTKAQLRGSSKFLPEDTYLLAN